MTEQNASAVDGCGARPIAIRSFADLNKLPSLESFRWGDDYEPFDATPLLALPSLRTVVLSTTYYSATGRILQNKRAFTLLERAGFRVKSQERVGWTVLERRVGAKRGRSASRRA